MRKIFFPSSRPEFVEQSKVIASLKAISAMLVKKNHAIEKIYLFGSFATGKATLYSDADILVVLSKDKRRIIDRLDEFIIEFSDAPVPVDTLVYTQEELQKMIGENNLFIKRIMREAIALSAS